MEVYECITTRRSCRAYKDMPIEREKLERVVESGRFAPSANDNQMARFIVLASKEALDEIAAVVRRAYAEMKEDDPKYASSQGVIEKSKDGSYVFHYDPSALVIVANKDGYSHAMADCACAIENMMIEANDLGLSSVWVNQLCAFERHPDVVGHLRKIGLADDEIVYGALSIGYAQVPNHDAPERKGNPVVYVE
ncbi:MAG TPA: nitroreductase family protein [Candidatus Aphodovivens excrementavium]|nr:nitroreductase family protein [Candidatus Aphodovivens avistercoris]HIT46119.1 nitroreductase family protein [Candidatus Aphodovivens excrementavium]